MKLVITLFGLLAAAYGTEGISTLCYFCDDCASYSEDQVMQCLEPSGKCTVSTTSDGTVNRNCMNSEIGDGCSSSQGTTTCICSTDRCNGQQYTSTTFAPEGISTLCYFCDDCASYSEDQVLRCLEPAGKCSVATTSTGVVNRYCINSVVEDGCTTSQDTEICVCSTDRCNGQQHTSTTFAPEGISTLCYVCDDCASYSEDQVMQCYEPSAKCTVSTSNGTVNRNCTNSEIGDGCSSSQGTTTCVCSTDLCNGSGHVYSSTMLALLVACLAGYYIR